MIEENKDTDKYIYTEENIKKRKTNKESGLISVQVSAEIKRAKETTGISWRSLIIRGIQSLQKTNDTEELKTKIAKMSEKLQQQSIRIYELENK